MIIGPLGDEPKALAVTPFILDGKKRNVSSTLVAAVYDRRCLILLRFRRS
jgi:hypothetical protein